MATDTQSARTIFLDALEESAGEKRKQFIDAACAGDESLRCEVLRLLEAHGDLNSFMGRPAAVASATINLPASEKVGAMIGRYKLLEQIGEGGMGVVYVAEQTEPVRRRVALKIIKPGMDTRQVIARFEAERQALAMMDHPNIAKVLDGGTTEEGIREQGLGSRGVESHLGANPRPPIPNPQPPAPSAGRPYFVMELVRGMPITDYCDQARLNPRGRLELFMTVCQAVQHAHQKGVIHRDLKPSNVLVTLHDGQPVVKVIDFGVAKAINQQLTERTIYTAFSEMIGTPLYMSPEQAELSGLDVDTHSDVYSLGVLLYELLTGQTPFDRDTLVKAGLDEVRRMIREVEPPRPSHRISTLKADAGSTVSQRRGFDQRQLSRALTGELDWIVMKALEKDRNRRYESASAFAADIERYLSHEPVEACPPSAIYRFRKFARRRRGALVAITFVAVSLLAGVGVSLWQAAEANIAREVAETQGELASANLFKAIEAVDGMLVHAGSEQLRGVPEADDARRAIIREAVGLLTGLQEKNDDNVELMAALAAAQVKLAAIQLDIETWEAAQKSYRNSVELYERLHNRLPESTDYVTALAAAKFRYSEVLTKLDSQEEAIRQQTQAISLAAAVPLQTNDPRSVAVYLNLQEIRSTDGQTQESIEGMLEANQAQIARQRPQAIAILHGAERTLASLSPATRNHPKVVRAAASLTRKLAEVDEPNAEKYWPSAIAQFRKLHDQDQLARSLLRFQKVLLAARRYDEASVLSKEIQEQLDGLIRQSPADPNYRALLATSYEILGEVSATLHDRQSAEAPLRLATQTWQDLARRLSIPAHHCRSARTAFFALADLVAQDSPQSAIEVHAEYVQLWRQLWQHFPARDYYFIYFCDAIRAQIAAIEQQFDGDHRDPEAAIRLWDEAIREVDEFVRRDENNLKGRQGLAYLYAHKAQYLSQQLDSAAQLLEARQKAIQIGKELENENNLRRFGLALAVLQYRVGDYRSSLARYEKTDHQRLARSGALERLQDQYSQPDGMAWDHFYLSMNHARLGHREKAQKWFNKGLAWMDKWDPAKALGNRDGTYPGQDYYEHHSPEFVPLHELRDEAAAVLAASQSSSTKQAQ